MEDRIRKLLIFIAFFIFAFIFWRLNVSLFYDEGEVSFFRGLTGLNIHHYHYGILFVLIAFFIFIFFKINNLGISLAGFGFGSFFDGFVSRLLMDGSRNLEIANYNNAFGASILLFIDIILIGVIFCITGELILKNKNIFYGRRL